MELPQPRPFGTEGGRKTTHDFLSLYSPVQQDPRSPQGGCLKTHDFLQPLERGGKTIAKEDHKFEVAAVEKPPPPAPPPSVEHILPGGIGTYSISYFNQRVPKPEVSLYAVAQASSVERNDENSNCSSYSQSSFTLWDESAVNKGKTGKENKVGDNVLKEAGVNIRAGQWMASLEHPSQSSSNHKHNATAFSSVSSSQPSTGQKNQSFLDMLTSAKNAPEDDEEEDDCVIKKEPPSLPKGDLSVKVDTKSTDQKPSTPRSKHSATEQRRRSKINDRFQMLRGIIPHSDQKRDKASFLLEVIEYIQFLQEKVSKYEASYPGWSQESSKLIPLRKVEGVLDPSQAANMSSGSPIVFAPKFEESNIGIPPVISVQGQHVIEANAAPSRESVQQSELTSMAASLSLPLQQKIFSFGGTLNGETSILPRTKSDGNKITSQPQSQDCQKRSYTIPVGDKMKDQELTIDSGTISISSIYSQGLLNSLTHALHSSGVDLSQASVSVQIDIGKRANGKLSSSASNIKGDDVSTSNQTLPRSIVTSTAENSDHALKRLRTSRS